MLSAGRGNTNLLVCNQIRSVLAVTLDQQIGVWSPGGSQYHQPGLFGTSNLCFPKSDFRAYGYRRLFMMMVNLESTVAHKSIAPGQRIVGFDHFSH